MASTRGPKLRVGNAHGAPELTSEEAHLLLLRFLLRFSHPRAEHRRPGPKWSDNRSSLADPSGAVVCDARVIVQNPGMGYEIDVQTNEEGIFTTEELEELSVASA